MASRDIRVLVVDDSAVVRSIIAESVAAAPGMELVGTAADGRQAMELLDCVRPDVITLDIQMPNMDGLTALDAILARRPLPVIMVSSLTTRGASMTLDALDRGAVDYLAKPDYGAGTRSALLDDLPRKIRTAAGLDVRRILEIRQERKQRRAEESHRRLPLQKDHRPAAMALADKCIAIGVSTGGPPALARLFESLRAPMPPMVVVQHMPASFTKPLAWRLDSLGELSIREAANGDLLEPNHVLIAPGGKHLQVRRHGASVKAVVRQGSPVSGHMPSADVLMKSVAETFGKDCLGVIMTGMGRDGADGCREVRARGGYVLGQDEGSSDVYGMNKVAYVEGNVDRQFALSAAAAVLTRHVRSRWAAAPRN
ncbi:MAG: chemotaxis response regulator protein-glutamate methylesterase [Pirellulales bacterium]|nr:chemotaxis response regulator protein-glutamate methylesterase [Pirellulales bacterium]